MQNSQGSDQIVTRRLRPNRISLEEDKTQSNTGNNQNVVHNPRRSRLESRGGLYSQLTNQIGEERELEEEPESSADD